MKNTVELRPADLPSLDYICLNLRKRDAIECFTIRGHENPLRLSRQAIDEAALAYVFVHNGEPVAYLGIAEGLSGLQAAAFGTDKWPLVARQLTIFIRSVLIPELLTTQFDTCEALSLAGHFPAQRWMKTLGAKPEGYRTINSRLFIRFVWRRAYVHDTAQAKEDARASEPIGRAI